MSRRAARADMPRRRSSTMHYHTFPTMPPKSRGRPPASEDSESSNEHEATPLPIKQLIILAIISLAEQTALNSISPYLPEMVAKFPGIREDMLGFAIGLVASCFAIAQVISNFGWGWLSDRIGRKPVIIIGTALSAVALGMFGFCRTLWQAILVQMFLGFVNGNAGIVSSCLGDITDRSNQSEAFKYLPIVYGLGGITGPLMGGLLAGKSVFNGGRATTFPYALPNICAMIVLLIDLVVVALYFEESHETRHSITKRFRSLFHREEEPLLRRDSDATASSEPPHYLNRNTILILTSYALFHMSIVAYNSLFPIFSSSHPPPGRDLSPREIGVSLSYAGVVGIVFQVFVFGPLRDKVGNKWSYRTSLLFFVFAFFLMPWVGYKDGDAIGKVSSKTALWVELGAILLLKTVATVGGLASVLLLITNSAPSHAVLGRLNGLAQTLASVGGAIGPFLSGGLFSLAYKLPHKGEAMPWGVFGGLAFIGLSLSIFIRGDHLEAEDWDSDID